MLSKAQLSLSQIDSDLFFLTHVELAFSDSRLYYTHVWLTRGPHLKCFSASSILGNLIGFKNILIR